MPIPPLLHLDLATTLLWEILQSNQGTDSVLKKGFAAHPQLGARDRHTLTDTVYGGLRALRSLGYRLHHPSVFPTDLTQVRERLALLIAAPQGEEWLARAWPAISLDAANRLQQALSSLPTLPPEVQADLPDWIYQPLLKELGVAELAILGTALNAPAPLDGRVNRIERAVLVSQLEESGLIVNPTPWSPWGLRFTGRPSLKDFPFYQQGLLEVQDEGSQLIAPLLAPRRGETVVDFCAGAGGKTLHIASLMADTGTLYACDPAENRLSQLRQRVARAGLQRVQVVRSDDGEARALRALKGKVHRVLVDAPCTGSGTLRRHPEIKWQRHDLARLVAEQGRILARAAALVRPGGCLVYATCSLLPAENQQVVDDFLANHPAFYRQPVGPRLARYTANLPLDGPDLRLWPHRHGTDGFYGGVLVKATI